MSARLAALSIAASGLTACTAVATTVTLDDQFRFVRADATVTAGVGEDATVDWQSNSASASNFSPTTFDTGLITASATAPTGSGSAQARAALASTLTLDPLGGAAFTADFATTASFTGTGDAVPSGFAAGGSRSTFGSSAFSVDFTITQPHDYAYVIDETGTTGNSIYFLRDLTTTADLHNTTGSFNGTLAPGSYRFHARKSAAFGSATDVAASLNLTPVPEPAAAAVCLAALAPYVLRRWRSW